MFTDKTILRDEWREVAQQEVFFGKLTESDGDITEGERIVIVDTYGDYCKVTNDKKRQIVIMNNYSDYLTL